MERRRLPADFLSQFSQLVAEMVELRLKAGHEPEDIAMSAWEMHETVVKVYVDGRWD